MKQVGFLLAATTALCLATNAYAQEENDLDALSELSLESLGQIVTSVSKKEEDPFKAPAAIYVITNEDIRISGATHIAEVLRGVPGLQVNRVDSSNWAITSRGFNDGFANKLLVLVDGRTVYTPLYSGVYWDIQDMILEDIERIEVIRGPGAALWGANAVNGVINIITKKAEHTQGLYVSTLVGNEDRTISEGRYGGSVGENLFYRAHAKYAYRDESITPSEQDGNNAWDNAKAGFRVDYDPNPNRYISMQAGAYDADIDLDLFVPSLASPPAVFREDSLDAFGGHLMGLWEETHNDKLKSTFQVYYDVATRDYSELDQEIHTLDFDYQTAWDVHPRHELLWGAGYRFIDDNHKGQNSIQLNPVKRDLSLYSAFIQDKIALAPNELYLTVGSKFEHNEYTGLEYQPNARIAWYPDETQTIWGSVSRAVRTPSRAENDILLNIQTQSTPFGSIMAQQQGNLGLESEDLTAYEIGYRYQPEPRLSFDVAAYVNDYEDLGTFEFGALNFPIQPLVVNNRGQGRAYGIEFSTSYDVTSNWNLLANYSYINLKVEKDMSSTDIVLESEEGKAPHHQAYIRSQLYLPHDVELTNHLYYTDSLPTYGIEDYFRFDTRVAWSPRPGIELSLVGQNLFEDEHQEFGAPLGGVANAIERSFYGKVTFRY